MSDETESFEQELALDSAGDQLRRAREDANMSVEQVAADTRIPQRHIESIEAGDFLALPSRAYAIGFSRSYAKLVGLDDGAITDKVREELARATGDLDHESQKYEPGDPSRVPSRRLAWFAAFAALLLIVGGFSFFRTYYAPGLGPAPLTDPAAEQQAEAGRAGEGAAVNPTAPVNRNGPVVFTALEDGVWVRFYDGSEDNVLLEKQMEEGETFTIPADSDEPLVRTGRPDAFEITIGGQRVAKLAEDDFVMSDEPVTAEALLSRTDEPAEDEPSSDTDGAST